MKSIELFNSPTILALAALASAQDSKVTSANSVHGKPSGRGSENSMFRFVTGWTKARRRANSATVAVSGPAAFPLEKPYLPSPNSGICREANCTRI